MIWNAGLNALYLIWLLKLELSVRVFPSMLPACSWLLCFILKIHLILTKFALLLLMNLPIKDYIMTVSEVTNSCIWIHKVTELCVVKTIAYVNYDGIWCGKMTVWILIWSVILCVIHILFTSFVFCWIHELFQASSPACTELETIVMDWLGKMIGLPPAFLHSSKDTPGGGVIQVWSKVLLSLQF